MSLKIDTDQSAVAYHIVDGAVRFNYAVDAQHAVSSHPNEWSTTPWAADEADAARQQLRSEGKTIADPEPLSPEDQAALDEHNAAVAAAAERLEAYRAKKAAEKAEADQVTMDEAIVASPPPRPDPNMRRPFGRPGEPTEKERAQMEKRAAAQADRDAERERIEKEKADLDKGAGVKITS